MNKKKKKSEEVSVFAHLLIQLAENVRNEKILMELSSAWQIRRDGDIESFDSRAGLGARSLACSLALSQVPCFVSFFYYHRNL